MPFDIRSVSFQSIVLALILMTCAFLLGACSSPQKLAGGTEPSALASRKFSGPEDLPPSGYAGYGVVVFPSEPDARRGAMFCDAFMRSLVSSTELEQDGVPSRQQMVTVWPVKNPSKVDRIIQENRDQTKVCDAAVKEYSLKDALAVLRKAERAEVKGESRGSLSGRGPFLLAWAPGGSMGNSDVPVLMADLSGVSTLLEAEVEFMRWRNDIEDTPQLWRDGWSVDRLKILIRRWANLRANSLLSILG